MKQNAYNPGPGPHLVPDATERQLRMLDEMALIERDVCDKMLQRFSSGSPDVVETLLTHAEILRSMRRTAALREKIKATAARNAARTALKQDNSFGPL